MARKTHRGNPKDYFMWIWSAQPQKLVRASNVAQLVWCRNATLTPEYCGRHGDHLRAKLQEAW